MTKTLDIDEKVFGCLSAEAERAGIPLGDLVSKVLEDYVSFTRHSKRARAMLIRAPFINIVFSQIPDSAVRKIGRVIGGEQPSKMLANFGLSLNWENALKMIEEFLGRQANWFEPRVERDEDVLKIVLNHGINRKWSLFLGEYMSALFESLGAPLREAKIDDFQIELWSRIPSHSLLNRPRQPGTPS